MSHIAHRLVEDTAWHPAGKAELEKWGTVQRTLFKIFLGSPLKLWASVGHWALWHFDLSLYTDKQKPRVRPHSAWPCTLLCRHADPPSSYVRIYSIPGRLFPECTLHLVSSEHRHPGMQ